MEYNYYNGRRQQKKKCYSTVTLFARFLGWSTSVPKRFAI
jgi:hypothetical protein